MKKIVSNVLVVSTQLIIGGLFLFMLFSNSNEDNKVVVVKNDNLNKMADAVSELFIVDQMEAKVDESVEIDLMTEEEKKALAEAEAKKKAEEEAKKKAEEEAAAKKKAEEEAAAAQAVTTYSTGSLQEYAHDLVINSYGWTENDFTCLVSLWNAESGWSVTAGNSSGAYGIPQALPGSKMASEGSDWATNGQTQIRWGLNYIRSTYGSPASAWAHFQSVNWY